MPASRKTGLSIQYTGKNMQSGNLKKNFKVSNKKNKKKQIKNRITSFTYIDAATGESDSISIDIANADKRWLNQWKPCKGDRINAFTILYNWNKEGTKKRFRCGSFLVDEVSLSGRPLMCNLGAVSKPINTGFDSKNRTKTYEKITVQEIAKTIAERANVKLYYDADKIPVKSIEQNKQTDSEFLSSLCEEYGLAMKIYSGKIVIFDEEKAELDKVVAVINETDMISWDWNTSQDKTYTGAKVTYTDPDNDKEHKIEIGKDTRQLEVDVTAFSKADAERKAKAKLAQENKKRTTMNITIPANIKIVASSCVSITGLRKISGKYYVDKVTHSIGGSGYTMSLELRKVKRRTGTKVFVQKSGLDLSEDVQIDFIDTEGVTESYE